MNVKSDSLLNSELFRNEFHTNHNLKLLVSPAETDAWQKLLAFLLSTDAQLCLLKNESPSELPENIESVFGETQHHYVLSIRLDGFTVLGPLSGSDLIELLINPQEIDDEAKARILFRLMSTIGRTLKKHIMLVREHEEDIPVFLYVPGEGVQYLGSSR